VIKLSDYIAEHLADVGVRHIFLVTGGGAMHLNDSFGKEQRIQAMCNHHEQACAMAAEGYARVTGKIGVINVTTGPGGINALNGVFGAWTDSIPMLVVSGQVKRETYLRSFDLPDLRQLGDQEADIVSMVKGITKYAVTVHDPRTIRYHLDKALHLATSGRPGPVWLDVPVDVQSSQVDEVALPAYDPAEDHAPWDMALIAAQCREIIDRLQASPRPVILAGSGVRHAGALDIFDRVIRRLGIPVTTAWTHDLIASDDPLFCGRPGTIGERAGNFTVQNAETLLIIGSRLNIRQVSYNWPAFARHAYKIQVDVDVAELHKPTVQPDLAVHCDARVFLEELDRQLDSSDYDAARHRDWLAWCKERVARYPVVLPKHRVFNGRINPYHFMEALFQHLADDDVVVAGNATACIVSFQTAFIKKGQRLFSNSGAASMGHDLPAAVGAAVARGGKRVICLAGDGSLQLNIQELQTVFHHQLPIKLFVLNNNGYLSIRLTQTNFFGNLVGEGPSSGVSFPDIVKVAAAYGLPAVRLDGADFATRLDDLLAMPGPVVCDVMLDPQQPFEPKTSSRQLPDGRMVSAPLEDMFPFLDRTELLSNLQIPPQEF
jgi:acetolactate synthase I/II/III large subunit